MEARDYGPYDSVASLCSDSFHKVLSSHVCPNVYELKRGIIQRELF